MLAVSGLPVTLGTASACAALASVLTLRVGFGRLRHRVSFGDGGHVDLTARIRTHANFAEHVPLILIQMALIEASGGSRGLLSLAGGLLVSARIVHAFGLRNAEPNALRGIGAMSTLLLGVALAAYGAVLLWMR